MRCELLFNVDPQFELTNQAIIALDKAVQVEWPLDEINQALEFVYADSMTLPKLYDIAGQGYLITALAFKQDEVEQYFWAAMQDAGYYDDQAKQFLQEMPFVVTGNYDGSAYAAVAYIRPSGPPLCVAPINDAITTLMGHPEWPDDMALYLYPGMTGDETYGLWIADSLDNFGDDETLQHVTFHQIRDLNHAKHIEEGYQPREYTVP